MLNICHIICITFTYTHVNPKFHPVFLSYVNYCCSSCRELRSKKHGKILIQMCFSLIGLYLSFLLTSLLGRFFYEDVSSNARKQVCITFSALVHYFLLVYFCITVAQSVLLYVQLVMVLGTKNILHHFQLRAGLVCWSKFLSTIKQQADKPTFRPWPLD